MYQIKLHSKEDTAKPENRVNITLFHLLMIGSFSNYLKKELNLPGDSFVYPSPNLVNEEFNAIGRPDLTIIQNSKTIGYIEVELGRENQEQLSRYRKQPLPVYSIVGKTDYNEGDLSLESLYHFLCSISDTVNIQTRLSIKVFQDLIEHYIINGNFNSNKRITISDKMRESYIILELIKYFGEDKIIENSRVEKKKIMINTVGEHGFSLRIFSTVTGSEGLSLMNRTGGSNQIYFPSNAKLLKYLPYKADECKLYSTLISELGYEEVFHIGEGQKAKLPLSIVEKNIRIFFDKITLLY